MSFEIGQNGRERIGSDIQKKNKRRQRFFLCHPPCDVEFFIIIDICRFVIIVHVLQALPRAIDKNDLVFFFDEKHLRE